MAKRKLEIIKNKKLYFALICGQGNLKNSEIALLSFEEAKEIVVKDF